ncbi:MAG: HAD family hydrolase [Campylobacteraceae bacterium]|nr:HAD family hydrolase [Campylobacteraceae bacterium]
MTILFDMDGTLIDSTPAILESFDAAFKKMNVKFSDFEKITSLIGYPLDLMFAKLGVKMDKTDEFVVAYKAHYKTVATKKTVLIDGTKEAVKIASTFANIGIVTTKTSLYTKEILKYFELLEFFKVVVGREDVKNPKPHPEPILRALSLLNDNTKNAWIIGDTILDLMAARDAKINSVGVLCGYGKKDDLMQFTDNIARNSLQAVTFVRDNFSKIP